MPNSKGRRRRFGAVRELQSGQWQARYRGPDGLMRPADHTFPDKTSAEVWLTRKEAEILNGDWIDPDAGRVLLGTYAAEWINERPGLRPKTIKLYRYLLRRHLKARTIRIQRQLAESADGGLSYDLPKSPAGLRTVPIPGLVHADVTDHLATIGTASEALLFTSPRGTLLRHSNFYRRAWLPAVKQAGLTGTHFHDLRHAGNTYTANAGANLRELMERMGHSSSRAAMIYLHSTDQRQRALADVVDKVARAELRKARENRAKRKKPARGDTASGTDVAHEGG
jgi:integrase